MPPQLKTDFTSHVGDPDYIQYPQDFDSNFIAILDSFNQIESDIAQFFAGTQVLFGTDFARRLEVTDPIGGALGRSFVLNYTDVPTLGSFTLVNQNNDNIGVINIGGERRQRFGLLTGVLQSLIDDGQVMDEGGGQWDGDIFIGVGPIQETDLQVAFSTQFTDVAIPIWEVQAQVTGLPGSPVWSFLRIRKNDRTVFFNNVGWQLRLERPIQLQASFKAAADERVVVVPFIHRLVSGYAYNAEIPAGGAQTATIDRILPTLQTDIVNPIAINGSQAQGVIQRGTIDFDSLNVIQPKDTAYLFEITGLTAIEQVVGIEVVQEFAEPIAP